MQCKVATNALSLDENLIEVNSECAGCVHYQKPECELALCSNLPQVGDDIANKTMSRQPYQIHTCTSTHPPGIRELPTHVQIVNQKAKTLHQMCVLSSTCRTHTLAQSSSQGQTDYLRVEDVQAAA